MIKKSVCPRIFIISEYVLANENSTGYYWSKIIHGLSLNFDLVYVICPKPELSNSFHTDDKNVNYILVNKIKHNKNNLLSRLYGQLFQSILFLYVVHKHVKAEDIIFSGTNPAPSLVLIALLKKIKNFKWLLMVHDVFPENLVSAKLLSNNNVIYRFSKFVFDYVYSVPDILIAIGRDMKIVLDKKINFQKEIVYIPNWADADEILPLPNIVNKRVNSGYVVFQFFGNLGRLQDINNILSAIKLVTSKNAKFEFIGNGSEMQTILDFIKTNPELLITHDFGVPFGSGNEILFDCDVAIVSLASGMNGLGVPSKAYFSLAADKPLLVITDRGSELHQLIEEEDAIGWYCESAQPDKLAHLIDVICESDLSLNFSKPRAIMLEKFEHTNAINEYSKLISRLTT